MTKVVENDPYSLNKRFNRSPTTSMSLPDIIDLVRYHGETLTVYKNDLYRLDKPYRSIAKIGKDLLELARQLESLP